MNGEVIEIVCDRVRDAFKLLKAESAVKEVQAFGDRLNVNVEDASKDFPHIELLLKQNGIAIESWRVITPSLENVFISLLTHNETNEDAA